MNREEILDFLNANPSCHLATVEGDTPRVRGMMMYRADSSGIVFHTGSPKDLCRQIEKNPKAEVCFNNAKSGIQVRVSGVAEFVDDRALEEEILAARPFLKSMVDAQGKSIMKVFRVKQCRATVWTMATNLAPKEYITL